MQNYRVEKILGKGTFGEVLLASDLRDGKFYALKKLNIGSYTVSFTIKQEIETLKQIKDICIPHLLCYEDYFKESGSGYLVTNYVAGYDLFELYKPENRHKIDPSGEVSDFDDEFAMNFLRQLVPVLEHLQQMRVAHRDIKPGNIIYNPITENFVLIDFGLSIVGKDQRFLGGSTGFISPFIYRQKVTNTRISINEWMKGDVYALGTTLFMLLNKRRPYQDSKTKRFLDYESPNDWIWDGDEEVISIVKMMLTGDYLASYVISSFKKFFDISSSFAAPAQDLEFDSGPGQVYSSPTSYNRSNASPNRSYVGSYDRS